VPLVQGVYVGSTQVLHSLYCTSNLTSIPASQLPIGERDRVPSKTTRAERPHKFRHDCRRQRQTHTPPQFPFTPRRSL